MIQRRSRRSWRRFARGEPCCCSRVMRFRSASPGSIFHREQMYPPGAVMQHPNGIRLTAFDAQGNVLHIGTYFLSTAVHRRARGDGQRGARGVQSNSLLDASAKTGSRTSASMVRVHPPLMEAGGPAIFKKSSDNNRPMRSLSHDIDRHFRIPIGPAETVFDHATRSPQPE